MSDDTDAAASSLVNHPIPAAMQVTINPTPLPDVLLHDDGDSEG